MLQFWKKLTYEELRLLNQVFIYNGTSASPYLIEGYYLRIRGIGQIYSPLGLLNVLRQGNPLEYYRVALHYQGTVRGFELTDCIPATEQTRKLLKDKEMFETLYG